MLFTKLTKIILHQRRQLNPHNSSIYKNKSPFVVWILDYTKLSLWNASISTSLLDKGNLFYFTNIASSSVEGIRNNNSIRRRSNFSGNLLLLGVLGNSLLGMASSACLFICWGDEIGLSIYQHSPIMWTRLDLFRVAFWWITALRNLKGWEIIFRKVLLIIGYLWDGLYSGNAKEYKKLIRTIEAEGIAVYLWDHWENYLYALRLWSFQAPMIAHQPSSQRGYPCIQSS